MKERELALPEEILLKIDHPARYLGNELNAVMKSEAEDLIRFVMCFPDVYEIGMSHLGIQILYEMFNRREDVWCERVYAPWPDLSSIMKEKKIPLFSLESQRPVKDADFLGITLQYEMCYTNILLVLDLAGIPLLQKERAEADPIVIGGGPCVYNPEPLADFFDCFYIGEGEVSYDAFLDLYRAFQSEGKSRQEFLHEASKIPGIYVPSLYEVTYREDGKIERFAHKDPEVPEKVKRVIVTDMDHAIYPEKPLVPFLQVTQDRVVLEVQRGCIRGCRFCQAGMVYRPVREKSLECLSHLAEVMLDQTGHEEISLSSLSTSDYSQLEPLMERLLEFKKKGVNISLPSLRIDSFSLDTMEKVQDVKKSSLTFAPEAGSQRMRDVINKNLTEEDILGGARLAFSGGWQKVKLYFMLGLPGEEDEDCAAIPALAEKIAEAYYEIPKEERNGKCQITISTSFFVPKPFTPFQWAAMMPAEEYVRRAGLVMDSLKEQLNKKSIRYIWHEPKETVLEGLLARGGRRLSNLLLSVYKKGAVFDAWTEWFDPKKWEEAIKETGTDVEFECMREREEGEILPWDFLDIGVTKGFLRREWKKAMEGQTTPNCREQCSGCGAAAFGTGVCVEAKDQVH
jgi:radical SAM family uncharacterized protein